MKKNLAYLLLSLQNGIVTEIKKEVVFTVYLSRSPKRGLDIEI